MLYWGESALQSFFGFSKGSTTWALVGEGEVVEEEADDIAEADVDEEEANANDGDRLKTTVRTAQRLAMKPQNSRQC